MSTGWNFFGMAFFFFLSKIAQKFLANTLMYQMHLFDGLCCCKKMIKETLLYENQLEHNSQTADDNINCIKGHQVDSAYTPMQLVHNLIRVDE